MDPSLEQVISEDKIRYTVLRRLWEKTEADPVRFTSFRYLMTEEEVSDGKVGPIVRYLEDKGLIRIKGISENDPIFSITHEGIKEVEQSIKLPEKATENFPSTVIQNFHGNIGAVQTGKNNNANIIQHNALDISEAIKLIQEIRQHTAFLPQEERQEAIEQLDDFETEINSPNPKGSKLKAPVQVLRDLAGKTATAAGFVDAVHSLSGWMPGFIQSLPKIGGS